MDWLSIWYFAQAHWASISASAVAGWGAITGLIAGYMRVRDFALLLTFRGRGYRVDSTLYKNVIENERTNVLKLRTLRIFGKLQHLDFDVWPTVEDPPKSRLQSGTPVFSTRKSGEGPRENHDQFRTGRTPETSQISCGRPCIYDRREFGRALHTAGSYSRRPRWQGLTGRRNTFSTNSLATRRW